MRRLIATTVLVGVLAAAPLAAGETRDEAQARATALLADAQAHPGTGQALVDIDEAIKILNDLQARRGWRLRLGPITIRPDQPVYSASECTGPVINGVCQGGIVPNTAVHPVCHGEMLNGQCTGPVF